MVMYRDGIHNNIIKVALAPGVKVAGENGPTIDLLGTGSCELCVQAGAIAGSGNMSVKVQDSPDGATWTDVPAGNLQFGSEYADPITTGLVERIGYVGAQRYVRLVSILNSGTSVAMAAVAVLGYVDRAPVV